MYARSYLAVLFCAFCETTIGQTRSGGGSETLSDKYPVGASYAAAPPLIAQEKTPATPVSAARNFLKDVDSAPQDPVPNRPTPFAQVQESDISEPEPWKLFNTKNIEIGGWSQTGYHTRSTGMFNNSPDSVRQHQMWLVAEKVADGSEGMGFGFRMDYVYGTDGPDSQAFGNPAGAWDEGWDNGAFYGSAIPQLYVEVASGDFSVKAGHFFTIAGYEVVQSTGNFFYSHAYTMFSAEPFTHTGVLSTYVMGDLTFYGGWTAGWDTGFATNDGNNFLGGVGLDLTDDWNVTYITTIGRIGNGTDQQGYSHSIVSKMALSDRLTLINQTDLVDFDGPVSGRRYATGLNNYLIYKMNDCWSAGTRFEWFKTEVGPGDAADLYSLTTGLNYKPGANITLRPEIRWSRVDDGVLIPTEDNNRYGFGCDAILLF